MYFNELKSILDKRLVGDDPLNSPYSYDIIKEKKIVKLYEYEVLNISIWAYENFTQKSTLILLLRDNIVYSPNQIDPLTVWDLERKIFARKLDSLKNKKIIKKIIELGKIKIHLNARLFSEINETGRIEIYCYEPVPKESMKEAALICKKVFNENKEEIFNKINLYLKDLSFSSFKKEIIINSPNTFLLYFVSKVSGEIR